MLSCKDGSVWESQAITNRNVHPYDGTSCFSVGLEFKVSLWYISGLLEKSTQKPDF